MVLQKRSKIDVWVCGDPGVGKKTLLHALNYRIDPASIDKVMQKKVDKCVENEIPYAYVNMDTYYHGREVKIAYQCRILEVEDELQQLFTLLDLQDEKLAEKIIIEWEKMMNRKPKAARILVGLKSDLERKISKEDIAEMQKSIGASIYLELSNFKAPATTVKNAVAKAYLDKENEERKKLPPTRIPDSHALDREDFSLEMFKAGLNEIGPEGNPPLIDSIRGYQSDKLLLMLQEGARTDILSTEKLPPLFVAIKYATSDVVSACIDGGCDIEERATEMKCTPLFYAAIGAKGSYIIRELVQMGANIEAPAEVGKLRPLHGACQVGNLEHIKVLVECGAELESMSEESKTPLWYAVENGHVEVVKFLLEKGASVKHTSWNGRSMVQDATDDAIKELIEKHTL